VWSSAARPVTAAAIMRNDAERAGERRDDAGAAAARQAGRQCVENAGAGEATTMSDVNRTRCSRRNPRKLYWLCWKKPRSRAKTVKPMSGWVTRLVQPLGVQELSERDNLEAWLPAGAESCGAWFLRSRSRSAAISVSPAGATPTEAAAPPPRAAVRRHGPASVRWPRHSAAKLVRSHPAGLRPKRVSPALCRGHGLTPVHAVERLRVEAARRLLSEFAPAVKRISQRCGFGSEETMRRSFLRLLAATPQDYRARFSS